MEVWNYRDELAVYDGIVFKGDRIVIPRDLRAEMMKRIHSSHQGEQACLRRARDVIFLPGMTSQIREDVSKCSVCALANYAVSQPKQPLMAPKLPMRHWSMMAQDLFSLGDKLYLITVESFSGFWEVDKLVDTHADTVIQKTKEHFSRYGAPD
eukprot:gene2128-2417_t